MRESATGPAMMVKFTSCLVNLSVIAGHQPTNYKYKNAKCYSCQKVGHLVSVCLKKEPPKNATPGKG